MKVPQLAKGTRVLCRKERREIRNYTYGLHQSRASNSHLSPDNHLQILLTIMTGAFGMAGYHFGRKPTSSSSEAPVSMAEGTMPWQTTSKGDGADEHFKYQYHPGGDKNKAPKDAPSALHSVIVPNVTLPKVKMPRP